MIPDWPIHDPKYLSPGGFQRGFQPAEDGRVHLVIDFKQVRVLDLHSMPGKRNVRD